MNRAATANENELTNWRFHADVCIAYCRLTFAAEGLGVNTTADDRNPALA